MMLEVSGLTASFQTCGGEITATEDVSFSIAKGAILGIVGESGSGKSVTALALMGLLPAPATSIRSGRIKYQNLKLSSRSMRRLRGPGIAMLFQEPMMSLNPVFTIGEQIIETIKAHNVPSPKQSFARAVEMPEPDSRDIVIKPTRQRH